MLKSMTAYGRADSQMDKREFTVEIKSVNSRFREIVLRLPQIVQVLEERIRRIIATRLKRGRIEISLQMKSNGDNGLKLELNRPLVKAYISVFKELNEELGCQDPINLTLFAQLRDTIIGKQNSVDIESVWPEIESVLEQALVSLDTMRLNEGKALEQDFLTRLAKIKKYIKQIRERSKEVYNSYKDRLKQKIIKLIEDIEITEDRLAQEIAFWGERSDITEELVRMESHLNQFIKYMGKDDVIGRRLEFLLQEMNREVNTIGAKAADSIISQLAVEIKAELEKLREQVQNVE